MLTTGGSVRIESEKSRNVDSTEPMMASDALDTVMRILCHNHTPLPEPESELVFHQRDNEQKEPLILVSDAHCHFVTQVEFAEDSAERIVERGRPTVFAFRHL